MLAALLSALFCGRSLPAASASRSDRPPPIPAPVAEAVAVTEDEYLQLPEDDLDVACGALLIAREIHPDLDIGRLLAEVDLLAETLRPTMVEARTPEEVILRLNRFFFEKKGLKYEPEQHFLNTVLTRKQGDCGSLSCLYLAVADRLKLPLRALQVPQHVFVRYEADGKIINIETTHEGRPFSNEQVIEHLNIPVDSVRTGAYLRPLTKREFLGVLLNNRGRVHYGEKRFAEALRDFDKAIEIHPQSAETYHNRGVVYKVKRQHAKALLDFERALLLNPSYAGAYANRGDIFAFAGQYQRALTNYDTAARLDPDDGRVYYMRARVHALEARKRETLRDLSRAIELDPSLKARARAEPCFRFWHGDAQFRGVVL